MEYTIKGIEGKYSTFEAAREDLTDMQCNGASDLIKAMESVAKDDPKLTIGLTYLKDVLNYIDMDYEFSRDNHESWFVNEYITEVLKMATFYGIPDIEIIWHGEYSDPELSYKGSVVNYYAVEDSMWEDYKDGCTENGIEATEDDFKVWMPNHADTVYDLLDMLTRDD